jgi:hypothetical protein
VNVKKILIAVLVVISAASLCYAAQGDSPKATEPVGAVIETGGVIVGRITSVVEESLGQKKASLILADENGKTRIIPLDNTVKIIDNTFHALTLNQLKKGKKVSVEVSNRGGVKKATSVKVME